MVTKVTLVTAKKNNFCGYLSLSCCFIKRERGQVFTWHFFKSLCFEGYLWREKVSVMWILDPLFLFDNAPRCGARTKGNHGTPCRSPAVRGKKRCRIHGGGKGSGAQPGNQNALSHGLTTSNAKCLRKSMREMIQKSKLVINAATKQLASDQ